MKQAIFFFLLLAGTTQFALAQPTQAEVDKMMKQAQEMIGKYSKDSNVSKGMNGMQNSIPKDAMQSNNSSFGKGSYEHLKLPPKKPQLLKLIPKKSLSQAEIKSMAATLLGQLKKHCDKKSVANIESLVSSAKEDDLSQLAVLLWYKNAIEESVMLSVYAVSQSPDDLALNNCGAILNLSGLSTYSVSFLKYALQNNPDNSTILNNIGQAYFSLGETDSASYYLMRCIKRSPLNPEGNKTEGVIETGKGDKDKAKKRIADAIKGGFTDEAKRIVRFLDPPVHYSHYIKPRVKVPEYFNPYKFELPVICHNRKDVPRALAEVDAYQRAIEVLIKEYGAMTAENFMIQVDKLPASAQRQPTPMRGSAGLVRINPFFTMGAAILSDLEKEFTSKLNDVTRRYKKMEDSVAILVRRHEIEFKELNERFDARDREYGERHEGPDPRGAKDRCAAIDGLFDRYQLEYASLAGNAQRQFFQLWADHINDISFWLYLGSASKTQFKEQFARYAAIYLGRLKGLSQISLPAFRYCDKDKWGKQEKQLKVQVPECPVNLEIFLGVGRINIDCEKFALELELLKIVEFNYEENFITGTSTIAFGAGFKAIPEVMPLTPVQLGVKQQFYITFDRNNSIADLGVLWEAEADLRGMNKPDAKATMKLGMLSGTLEIDEGALKPIADKIFGIKPEQQINKKVELYNKQG